MNILYLIETGIVFGVAIDVMIITVIGMTATLLRG